MASSTVDLSMCIDGSPQWRGLPTSSRHVSAWTTFALLWEMSGGEPMRGWESLFLAGLAAAYPELYAETSSIDLSDPDEVLIAADAVRRWRSDVVSRHFPEGGA
jgi:hypothetical protein